MDWQAQLLQKQTAIRERIQRWYERHARDLPWRRTCDPYHVWLSETMLQQTRVDTVIPYYERFLAQFPDVKALAAAPEDRVLKAWEGLGYYTRARNLHRAAKAIARDRGGRFPETAAEWQALPGVGAYTAGAVASIAFGERVPALDGNINRVLARVFGIRDCIDEAPTKRKLREIAQGLLPQEGAGDFNQALMDIGSGLCTPTGPKCLFCPLQPVCEAHGADDVEALPIRRRRQEIPQHEGVFAVICKARRYLLAKRRSEGLLGGLWTFPGGRLLKGETDYDALARVAEEHLGVLLRDARVLGQVSQTYSHFRLNAYVYECRLATSKPRPRGYSEVRWVAPDGLDHCPMSKIDHKILELLDLRQDT